MSETTSPFFRAHRTGKPTMIASVLVLGLSVGTLVVAAVVLVTLFRAMGRLDASGQLRTIEILTAKGKRPCIRNLQIYD